MTRNSSLGSICSVVACLALAACSDDEAFTGAKLPHFHDITSAPLPIQTAARAVVLLETAGQTGTGSFISSSGLLMTNNHVLGAPVCPIEGCYVDITMLRQRGEEWSAARTVFAVPVAVDVGLDLATLQIYDQKGGSPLLTSGYLRFHSQSVSELLNQHVTIVGHPEGYLKKWTDGFVVDSDGFWFTSTAFVLPGNSGSPVLNDEGEVVGLLHRSPTLQDSYTSQGVNTQSIATAAANIEAALNTPLPTIMVSTQAASTRTEFLAHDRAFLNAHGSSVLVDGRSEEALKILGEACDATLVRTDFESPDELTEALGPCYEAHLWIDCRSDAPSVSYGVLCPDAAERELWRSRFWAIEDLWRNMNGHALYSYGSQAIARLQPTRRDGLQVGAESLQQLIEETVPVLDFELAYYLASFGIGSYNRESIRDYIVRHQQIPHYELQAEYIAYAASWLRYLGSITKDELGSVLKSLVNDPKVGLGARLASEDLLFNLGEL